MESRGDGVAVIKSSAVQRLAQAQTMLMPEILGLLALLSGGWFLWDSMKAREAANVAMRDACKAEELLFLDDTVALKSVWPVRNDQGHVRLRRVYAFEYSDTGHNRRTGRITLVADKVSVLYIGLRATPDGETLQ
jgi:hypothetical protein